MLFDEWCAEYIRLLLEYDPQWSPLSAKELAESEMEAFQNGMSPQEALEDRIATWTDDGSGE
jgi:hypothetical protein